MSENASQNTSAVVEHLRGWNAKAIAEVVQINGETTIVVPRNVLIDVATECRDRLKFDLLSDLTSLDRFPVEPRFEVNYHLTSIPRKDKIRLRVKLAGSDAVVDSVTRVWPGAGWMEREVFDLMGIRFEGHPDLRRIVLPEEWEGYPLRRDYPVEGYRDIPIPERMFRNSNV